MAVLTLWLQVSDYEYYARFTLKRQVRRKTFIFLSSVYQLPEVKNEDLWWMAVNWYIACFLLAMGLTTATM